ncbi:MAG TPA: SCP2 sterol-binding domain-containing protein [Capillimicrobium sp.]|nr:SCP2 sterol-binding domain-containing protein [Capillimicrobium sp.]
MGDTTTEFFERVARRGHEPMLDKARGTIRFERVDGARTDQWRVTIDCGDVSVSHGPGDADCVVRADADVLDAVASGEANAFTAILRGEIAFEGDPELLVLFQRLLPATPGRAPMTDGAVPHGARG